MMPRACAAGHVQPGSGLGRNAKGRCWGAKGRAPRDKTATSFCCLMPTPSCHAALPSPPGKLITWTKGFTCEGVVGRDPVQLLEQALKRAGRPCRVGGLRGACCHAAMLSCVMVIWS